jgi:type VI secretion system ImpC/EvpB family protein
MSFVTPDCVTDRGLAAPATSAVRLPRVSLLDSVLDASQQATGQGPPGLAEFLREPSLDRAVALWLNLSSAPEPLPRTKEEIAQLLSRDIARIDGVLTRQVNAILHHPAFQKLEASWRGVRYLVDQVPEGENIKIRVLNASWKEVSRDVERALEFDQSQLFRKIYGEEFGSPGGEPFGVLLGDYETRPRPGPEHPIDDMGALLRLSAIAAAAFAPFVAGVHPSFLGLDSFTELEQRLNLPQHFEQLEYLKWRSLRRTEDARFVGLVLPRVLRRLPYRDVVTRVDGFRFHEDVEAPDRSGYLWGNAVYAFGGVLVRTFGQSGWLADIRGVRPGESSGGLVTGLPVHSFVTDPVGVAPRSSTDALITDAQEKELDELGFMSLCHCPDTDLAAFYGTPSVQRPARFDQPAARANAKLSAMLQYMLCVARFAHYLKVIARDKVGTFMGARECEEYLRRWLQDYTASDDESDQATKARYPLREAQVQIREHPGKPGSYLGVFHLRPHFQLDQIVTAVRLATELAPGQPH